MTYLEIHTAINRHQTNRLEQEYILKKFYSELKKDKKENSVFFGKCYKSFKQRLISLHHDVDINNIEKMDFNMFSNVVKSTFNDLSITNDIFCEASSLFGEFQKSIGAIKKNRKGVKKFYISGIDRVALDTFLPTKLKWLREFAKEKKVDIVTTCELVNMPINYSLYYRGQVAYSPPIPKLKTKIKHVDQVNFLIRPSDFGYSFPEGSRNTESSILSTFLQVDGKPPVSNTFGEVRV